jgi:hypothetical protein
MMGLKSSDKGEGSPSSAARRFESRVVAISNWRSCGFGSKESPMGKAALDLPEPVETTPAAPENAGTDDLLAQLAGQEIDRLLADADVPREGAAAPASAESTPAAKAETPAADPTASKIPAAPAPIQVAPAPAQPGRSRLSSREPETPPAPTPVPVSPAEPPKSLLPNLDAPRAEQAIGDIIGTLDPELEEATREPTETAPTERAALDAALGPAAATLTTDQLATEPDDDDAPLPLYLRPIEWLNACFDSIPETILEAAGKIAILTMVNAVAVLLYVLFFRHH